MAKNRSGPNPKGLKKTTKKNYDWFRILAIASQGSIMQRCVCRDPLIQAMLLTAYAPTVGKLDREPLHVFQWFVNRFTPLLPEKTCILPSVKNQEWWIGKFGRAQNPRACVRAQIAYLLQTNQGSPGLITLAFCSLAQVLGIHQRLCCIIPAEDNRRLNENDLLRLLQVQVGDQPSRLTMPEPINPPIYWCEVFWPLVDAWVGIEFHNGRINCASERLIDRSNTLKPDEFHPKYLQTHLAKVAARIPPDLISQRNEDYSAKETSLFANLLLGEDDSSDDRSSSSEESEKPCPAAVPEESPPIDRQSKLPRLEDSRNLMSSFGQLQRLCAEQRRLELSIMNLEAQVNPWIMQPDGRRAISLQFGALAISPHGHVADVSPRYFDCYKCSTPKFRKDMQMALTTLASTSLIAQDDPDEVSAQHLYELDELKLEDFRRSGESAPISIAQFRASKAYVLQSLLKPNELLLEGAKARGIFKNEPFYSRSDVLRLYTSRELEKMARKVRPGSQALKVNNQGADLFSLAQSEIVTEDAVKESEAHVWHVKNHLSVPKGFTYLKESIFPSITFTAKKQDVRFFHALVGYKYEGGRLKPVYDGVVVKESDVELLVERQKCEIKLLFNIFLRGFRFPRIQAQEA